MRIVRLYIIIKKKPCVWSFTVECQIIKIFKLKSKIRLLGNFHIAVDTFALSKKFIVNLCCFVNCNAAQKHIVVWCVAKLSCPSYLNRKKMLNVACQISKSSTENHVKLCKKILNCIYHTLQINTAFLVFLYSVAS